MSCAVSWRPLVGGRSRQNTLSRMVKTIVTSSGMVQLSARAPVIADTGTMSVSKANTSRSIAQSPMARFSLTPLMAL